MALSGFTLLLAAEYGLFCLSIRRRLGGLDSIRGASGRPIRGNEIREAVGSGLLAMSDEGRYRLSTGFSSTLPFSSRERSRFRLREGSRTLQYDFESPGWVRLGLFTAAGRLAIPVAQGLQEGGARAFPLTPLVRPGSYVLRMETLQGAAGHLLRIEQRKLLPPIDRSRCLELDTEGYPVGNL